MGIRGFFFVLSIGGMGFLLGSPTQAQSLFSEVLDKPQDLHLCKSSQECISEYISSCQPAEAEITTEVKLGDLSLAVERQIEVWGQTPAGCLVYTESLEIQIRDLPERYSDQSGLDEPELLRQIESQIPLMRSWCQCELEDLDLCAELSLGRTDGVTFGTAESPIDLPTTPFDPETTPSFSQSSIDDRLIQTCEIYLKPTSTESQIPQNLYKSTLEDLVAHLGADPRITRVESSPIGSVIFELRRQISDSAKITLNVEDVELSFLAFQVKLGRYPASVIENGITWYYGMSLEPDDCVTSDQILFCLDPESDPDVSSNEIRTFFTEVTRVSVAYQLDCGEYPSGLEDLWSGRCPNGATLDQPWLDPDSTPAEIQYGTQVDQEGGAVFTLIGEGRNQGIVCTSDFQPNKCRWDAEQLQKVQQGTATVFARFQEF